MVQQQYQLVAKFTAIKTVPMEDINVRVVNYNRQIRPSHKTPPTLPLLSSPRRGEIKMPMTSWIRLMAPCIS